MPSARIRAAGGAQPPTLTANASATPAEPDKAPARAGLVAAALILVATVANLNLAVANVALPSIGVSFQASQTALDLVAVGYSLGLAASVLYLGALGDRYGRKLMLVVGTALAIPASLLAGFAPTIYVLFAARLLGGLAAGMAYPTTLALITALWAGPRRTKVIALWSATGGAATALGAMIAGVLLTKYGWPSVFVMSAPLAVIALAMAWLLVPAHVDESKDPVDHLGGVLSIVLVGSLVLGINFVAVPGGGKAALGLFGIFALALLGFLARQRAAKFPLYDLKVAARPVFWVAACAGIIVFGTLMAAMFIGPQFLQNVLGYNSAQAGFAVLPAVVFMMVAAPISAQLVNTRGARFTLLIGYAVILVAFVVMLLLWTENATYWPVALAYGLVGLGVGFAGTPASHSLTGSVPVSRAGMASGTADLQRDLGGAIMQSILGALLTAGYASAFASTIAASPQSARVSSAVQNELTKSYASAQAVAQQYPQYSAQITAAAKSSFLAGADWAYAAGIIAIVLGAALVFFVFPNHDREKELLTEYAAEDSA